MTGQAVLPWVEQNTRNGRATFDIIRSPSYQVPVLYFTVQRENGSTVQNVDTIYTALVPLAMRNSVSAAGTIGGISMTVTKTIRLRETDSDIQCRTIRSQADQLSSFTLA